MTARHLVEAIGAEWYGGYWRTRCPAHDDRASPGALCFSARPDGSTRLVCLLGCAPAAVVEAIRTTRGIDPHGPWPPLRVDPRIKRLRGGS